MIIHLHTYKAKPFGINYAKWIFSYNSNNSNGIAFLLQLFFSYSIYFILVSKPLYTSSLVFFINSEILKNPILLELQQINVVSSKLIDTDLI